MSPVLRLARHSMKWMPAALIMIPGGCFSVDEQQFGRLFTTPEQRQRLQELRAAHRRDRDTGNATAPGSRERSAGRGAGTLQDGRSSVPDKPPIITFKGLVYKQDGAGMAWLEAQEGSAALDYRQLQPGEAAADSFAISVPVSGQSVKLKPGQSYDPQSGAVTDLGEIVP